MNKALIAVLMLCIIGGSAAFSVDPETCFTKAATFSHQVKILVSTVQTSPLQIANLLGSAYDTFESVNPLIQGCGLDFPLLDKVDNLKPANATQCFNDIEKLANIALELKAANDKEDLSKNIFDILPKISDAFKIFKQAAIDCQVVQKQPLLTSNGFDVNIFKCIEEAKITLTNAKKFVADYKAGDAIPMEDLFEEGINVYNEFVVLVRDCGLQKVALPQVNHVSELKTCVKDIKNTVFAVEQSFADLKSRKFVQLFTDAKNIYAAIITDVADCKKQSLLSSADVFACIADGLSVAKDLKKFVDSAKSKSTKDIVIGAYTVLGELQPMAKDCDLSLPFDLPTINPNDLENCAANTDGLVSTISQLAKDVSDKKLWNIVGDAAAAVTQLKSIVNDCKNKSLLADGANPLTCITKAKGLYEQVVALIDNSKTKNVPEIVFGAYTIVESLQPLVDECGLKFDLHIPTITFPDLKGCVVDTQSLITTFTTIKEDYTQKNYLKIFDDATVVVETLQTIANECKPTKALQTGIDVLACLSNAKALYENVDSLIADAKNKAPANEIVVLSYNTIESLQPLVDSCGLKVDLHIPQITFPDLNGCVIDTEALVNTIKAIRDDIKTKNFSQIFDDVAISLVTLNQIANECKPIKALQTGIDVLGCLSNAKALYENVDKLIADSKNKAPVNEIVVLSYNTIEALQPMVDSCGIKVDLHIPKITFPDLNGCVVDTQGLVGTIKAIRDDIKTKNFSQIFDDVALTLVTLNQIANECKPIKSLQAGVDILTCISNAKALYENIDKIVADSKNKAPVNEIVVQSYNTIESLQPFVDSCGIKVDLHIPKITFPDLSGCVIDAQGLVGTIKAIRDDIKTKNFSQIFDDVALTLVTLNQIATECKPIKSLQAGIDVLACINNAKSLYLNADTLIADAKNKAPVNEIVVLSYNIVESLQPLVSSCGLNFDLHIPVITFPDLNGCVIDASGLVNTIKAIKNDVVEKRFLDIFDHASEAVLTLQSIATECKPVKSLLTFNILKCFSSGSKVLADVKNFLEITKNSKPANEVIVAAFNTLKELQPLVNDCDLKIDLHIPDIDFNDLNGCVVDTTNIIDDFKNLSKQLSNKDYISIIGTIQGAIAHVKAVADECKVHKNTKFALQANILTCAKEAQTMFKRASTLVSEFKNKQVSDVVVSAYDIVENLQTLVDACVPKKVDLHIPKINFTNLKQCVVDVQTVISIVKTIKSDVQVKNWNKIVGDAKSFIATFNTIKNDCAASKKLELDPSKVLQCLASAKQVYEDVQNIVNINKEKRPINEIVVSAFGLVEEIQPFFEVCGIKADLHIPQIDFNDLNGCVVDGEKVVTGLKALAADLKSKNLLNLVADLQAILTASKNVATECKTQKKPTLEAALNLKCVKQVGNIAKDAFKVYKDLNNDSTDILSKLLTIQHFLTDLQPACNDCGIKVTIPTIPSDSKVIATVECAADVTKLVSSVGSLYTDATALNVIKVVSDVKTIISSFSDAKDKCTSINKLTV